MELYGLENAHVDRARAQKERQQMRNVAQGTALERRHFLEHVPKHKLGLPLLF